MTRILINYIKRFLNYSLLLITFKLYFRALYCAFLIIFTLSLKIVLWLFLIIYAYSETWVMLFYFTFLFFNLGHCKTFEFDVVIKKKLKKKKKTPHTFLFKVTCGQWHKLYFSAFTWEIINDRLKAGKDVYFPFKLGNFSAIYYVFYVQNDKISLQIPKFPSKHQRSPWTSLPFILFSHCELTK